MIKQILISISALLLCCFVRAQDCQEKLGYMAEKTFGDCAFGAMFCYEDGTPIASFLPDRKLMPASNMKVLTTACALEKLGPDFRWTTSLALDGEIDGDGTLLGDLWIIGGGDPAIGTKEKSAELYFSQWLEIIKGAGIKRIDGRIIGDGSSLEGMREDPSWCYEDLGTYFGTCLSGLNFYENMQDFSVSAGSAPNDSLRIEASYPPSPWMEWTFDCTTGNPGTGDKLFLYCDAAYPSGVLRGTFAAGKQPKTVHCRNNYPEYTLANEFCKYLENNQFSVSGGPGMLQFSGSPAPGMTSMEIIPSRKENLPEIGSTTSPALRDIVRKCLEMSDNFYAEMIFRTLGRQIGGSSTAKTSAEVLRAAVSEIIAESGAQSGPERIIITDGSGLSMRNCFSPSLMCDFLRGEMHSAHFKQFLSALTPFGNRIRLKTGSFTGCRTLCGYILPSGSETRTIVFSMMVNNSHLATSRIDKIERDFLKNNWQ